MAVFPIDVGLGTLLPQLLAYDNWPMAERRYSFQMFGTDPNDRPSRRDLWTQSKGNEMDDKTRVELEAAAFRRLQKHLMSDRPDVQNIDMMNLTGFCRNCLSRWYQEAAVERGIAMSKDASREEFYGMPFEDWKAKFQTEATPEQRAAFDATHKSAD